ncbi:peroxidase 60 [Nicotiana tomentosiformis]|uniref:peroxidase 60 n=1 Tax=Nicotiana tomentosiformis TaxID=4098 RepID=UPI00051B100B|nr:peroxidase 60 [Nicotiana tomentosiformis]
MSKAVALVIVLFLGLFSDHCYGQLRVGFYKGIKCGQKDVEGVVREVVKSWRFTKDKTIAAALLRMQFHDCFVNGCDASILLDGDNSEKKAGANKSVRGYELIDAIKQVLETECQGAEVSCADIISLATRDAVLLSGGKWYNVETGRRDGSVSLASNVNLPGPSISVSDSIKVFASKGLNAPDMVYLLGGHTVGTAHCSNFQDRLYNYKKTGGPDPAMNKLMLFSLRMKCPRSSNFDNSVPLDMGTPSVVDNSFYQQIKWGNGVLEIDQQIALDPLTNKTVDDIVKGSDFYTKFGEAMVKLGRVEVLTGTQGEVRKSCRAVNNNNNKPFILF